MGDDEKPQRSEEDEKKEREAEFKAWVTEDKTTRSKIELGDFVTMKVCLREGAAFCLRSASDARSRRMLCSYSFLGQSNLKLQFMLYCMDSFTLFPFIHSLRWTNTLNST